MLLSGYLVLFKNYVFGKAHFTCKLIVEHIEFNEMFSTLKFFDRYVGVSYLVVNFIFLVLRGNLVGNFLTDQFSSHSFALNKPS